MSKIYLNKKDNTQVVLIGEVDGMYQIQLADKTIKTVAESTFKRWYKLFSTGELEQRQEVIVVPKTSKYKYVAPSYKRNEAPLWDAIGDDNVLEVRDQDKNIVMTVTKTDNCFRVCQLSNMAKRYFKDADKTFKHICNNQDINTIKRLKRTFDEWAN